MGGQQVFGLFNRKKTPRCGIYAIVNRSTGERYVGQSLNITERWAAHRKDLDAGTHHSEGLQKAWEKLGPGDFDFVVLRECHPEEFDDFEDAYIQEKGEYNRVKHKMTVVIRASGAVGMGANAGLSPEELDAEKAGGSEGNPFTDSMIQLYTEMTPEQQTDLVENLKTITKTLDSMTEEERADFYAEHEAKADAEDEFFEAIQDMDDEELEAIDRSTLDETMIEILDEEIELQQASEQ